MLKNFFILLLITLLFSACTNEKNIATPTVQNNIYTQTSLQDEFAQEFEVKEPFDPLSGYNRVMTNFNDKVYVNVLNPISRGYGYVLPEEVRIGINKMFDNLLFPVRLANNILQLKVQNSLDEIARFIINSTAGLFGFFDPAKSYFKIMPHKEDLGQTLGYWGVGSGFHIVLPILGPSNLRDLVGSTGDAFIDPTNHLAPSEYAIPDDVGYTLALKLFANVNNTSLNVDAYENLKKDAVDLYPYLRDIYEQRREKLIKE